MILFLSLIVPVFVLITSILGGFYLASMLMEGTLNRIAKEEEQKIPYREGITIDFLVLILMTVLVISYGIIVAYLTYKGINCLA